MGIINLLSFLKQKQCCEEFNNNALHLQNETFDTVLFDINTFLHKTCYILQVQHESEIYGCLETLKSSIIEEIAFIVGTILPTLKSEIETMNVFIGLDGISPPGKRFLQKKRRMNFNIWNYSLTAGSKFLKLLFDENFVKDCMKRLHLIQTYFSTNVKRILFFIDTDEQPNEGEIKCVKFLKLCDSKNCLFVSTDNDVIALSFLLNERNISVLTENSFNVNNDKRLICANKNVKYLLFNNDELHLKFYGFMLFAVFGGDYLPPFFASKSLRQMEAVYDIVNDYKIQFTDNVKNLDLMFTDLNVLSRVIYITLNVFKCLSKHRRCLNPTTVSEEKQVLVLQNFFSDLLWVYGHYSGNDNISINRINFLVQSKLGYDSFVGIRNDMFQNNKLFNKLDVSIIRADAISESCSKDSEWNKLDKFRTFILNNAV